MLAKTIVRIRSGGRQQRPNGAQVAQAIAVLAVSPKGDTNRVIRISSLTALKNALDTGKGADIAAYVGAAYFVPIAPSTEGDVSSTVARTGTGLATIAVSLAPHRLIEVKITTAGILGTSKFRYRVGGVGPFSAEIATVASFRVPGTFTLLAFGAGTYVLNSTYTVGLNGAITLGGSAIATVTQTSSPLDDYDFVITVSKAGALNVAKIQVSPDGGRSTIGDYLIPTGGVVVIPNTGIVLTCSVGPGDFVADDTYSFLCLAPAYSTSDLQAALEALRADGTAALALVEVPGMPATAAAAISAAATISTQMETANDEDGLDWQAFCDCPLAGEAAVPSAGDVILDTADTSSALLTARAGQDLHRTAVFYATSRITSPLTGWKLRRGRSVGAAARFNDTEPRIDLADRSIGSLDVFEMGVDAADYVELDDAQFNGYQSERHLGPGSFIALSSGGYGVKNMTTDADFQDASGVRALNCGVRALRPVLESFKAQRPDVNPDGTIAPQVKDAWDKLVDRAIKRGVGLAPGGDFANPQAADASASVLETSQLGDSPHRLDVEFSLQKLGIVSDVEADGVYSGTITA